jgi:hypothetical protein
MTHRSYVHRCHGYRVRLFSAKTNVQCRPEVAVHVMVEPKPTPGVSKLVGNTLSLCLPGELISIVLWFVRSRCLTLELPRVRSESQTEKTEETNWWLT